MKMPCCKEEVCESDIWDSCNGDSMGTSSKDMDCPKCGRALTVYLDIDSVEVAEE